MLRKTKALTNETCEKEVIFDDEDEDEAFADDILSEDEDGSDWEDEDENADDNLYDTKFDKIDEIVFVKEQLDNLQANN